MRRAWELAKALWIWDFHLLSLVTGLLFGALLVFLVVYIKTWRSSQRHRRASQRLERIFLEKWKRKP